MTPWTVAYQALPSMRFSRQEYWSGLPFPSPGDLPNPGIEPGSPAVQTDALPSESDPSPVFHDFHKVHPVLVLYDTSGIRGFSEKTSINVKCQGAKYESSASGEGSTSHS